VTIQDVQSSDTPNEGRSIWNANDQELDGRVSDLEEGGATTLDGLTDVTIASPSDGEVLKFNGTAWVNDTDETAEGGGGVTDHGALTGLSDDDHTQYHNDARGDARYPPLARTISTTAPLSGGGDLSANRTLSVAAASETVAGAVELATSAETTTGTSTTLATHPAGVKAVADTKVPTSRTITTTAPLSGGGDLSANRTLTVGAASDTATGVVELATDAETQTGSDTARVITPANLSARTATESRTGVAELSTNAEALTGTDTARVTTPANVKHVLDSRTASESATGLVELATTGEVTTGTDTTRVVTPAGVKAAIDARFGYEVIYWVFDGTGAIVSGNKRVPIMFAGTPVKLSATASTAPVTSALTFDINENGTTIMTTKLSIAAAGNFASTTTFTDTTLTEDNYLTCDIDAVGSGGAGSNIVVAFKYRYAL
jgi:hypothetical protein